MDEKDINLSFSFTDEYGETTTLNKTYNQVDDELGKVLWLLEEFKCFLRAYGFHKTSIDNIVYLEKGEKVLNKDGELVIERK